MTTPTWSSVQLQRIPPPSEADRLATALRRAHLGPDQVEEPISDLDRLLVEATASLEITDLGAHRGGLEAAVLPARGGFRVLVDPAVRTEVNGLNAELTGNLGRQRLRFRVLHELAHTFFYDRSDVPVRVVDGSAAQEAFCDRLAASFLLPTSVVAREQASPEAITMLQARYDVSLQLCVRRFAEVHRHELFAVLAAIGRHEPRLRTQWAAPDRGQKARWWTADWIQGLLARPGPVQGMVAGQNGDLEACALPLLARSQVVLVGGVPESS